MFKYTLMLCLQWLLCLTADRLLAQNPLVRDQFTADPSARVFGDRIYIYPSHDIIATEGRGRAGWFCMEDYHVFSSDNLTDWTDHGVIVQQHTVPWVKPASYSMWAPDCIYRNGKYFFYFPSVPEDTNTARGFTIGVAIADKPEGPFVPQPSPIAKVRGIDPNVFIDKDGQAYLYWSQGNIYGAKLKENMIELASDPVVLQSLPAKGLKEGPYMFERNGIYYMTYPHVENKIERIEYATGNTPLGPFEFAGVIMDESPVGCWTNHHSILPFKGQWYIFYHSNDYSPAFDKARSIRADSLFFNGDGSIRKVKPTYRGIGVTKASSSIQVDRYTDRSFEGVTIDFLDTANKFRGWKSVFEASGSWIQYNAVDFGKQAFKTVSVSVFSPAGGHLQIRIQDKQGPVLAEIPVPAGNEWQLVKAPLLRFVPGIQNLFLVSKNKDRIEVDQAGFE
jgi:hypothetical protein